MEISLAGLDIGTARCNMLAKCMKNNESLLSIDMSRRNIEDGDGLILAKMLHHNKKLRNLELEGNLLGP